MVWISQVMFRELVVVVVLLLVLLTDIKGSAKALGSKLEIREIDPREIYFLQGTCSDTFPRCGRSLADTTQELTSRRVDPLLEDPFWSACPMLGSWRNG